MHCFSPRFGFTFGSGVAARDEFICIERYRAYFFLHDTPATEALSPPHWQ